jgi:hypothetical protein
MATAIRATFFFLTITYSASRAYGAISRRAEVAATAPRAPQLLAAALLIGEAGDRKTQFGGAAREQV